jgi:hypothetical protein
MSNKGVKLFIIASKRKEKGFNMGVARWVAGFFDVGQDTAGKDACPTQVVHDGCLVRGD